ncbi:MAG: hypothetical protein FD122_1346 [Stygiobacter sp.]|nr:MAG: hypothetical protein FD122_1346 [Stygiobacter sp.]KAF0218009.1 MAG: hypothetical protein FD178_243 [Ignavibacteria bacterium]
MYARYTERLTFRLGQPYKDMLAELSADAKSPMSTIARDIFEQSIERRYKKLKSPPSPPRKKTAGVKAFKPMVFGKIPSKVSVAIAETSPSENT